MSASTSTTERRCEFCSEPLKVVRVELFGKPRDVACYGSCGCQRSRERLASYEPRQRDSEAIPHRCPQCGGTMRPDPTTEWTSRCPWCGHECAFSSDLQRWRESAEAERREARGGILAGTGVPELYWSVEPDHGLADRIEQTGRGLYIVGGNGTLKTLTATAVAKAYAERGRSVRFASSVGMLSEFRSTYGSDRSEEDVMAELAGCDLLVVDDLGKENPTSWAATMLYQVVDRRYGSRRPVVVTTNFDGGALAARLAQTFDESTARALMSRLVEMTEEMVLDGPDRRIA